MMKKRMRQGGAFLLAVIVAFAVFVLPKSYAAIGVEVDRKCSMEICAPVDEFSELRTLPVEVSLYKVADITIEGRYESTEDFSALDFSGVDSETKAAEWDQILAEAKELITAETERTEAVLQNGSVKVDGLETGMYLVDVEQADSPTYQYDFTAFLVSLPNNYYYDPDKGGDDTWVYDLTGDNAVVLKAEKTDLLGDLVIVKELDVYNETLDGAAFVFQVEAFKKDIDKVYEEGDKGKCVYSNVVSLTFDGPGTGSLTIKDIPAGAEVVVTEVYTGANYKLVSDAEKTAVIVANGLEGAPATVTFENTSDGGMNGGNGVVNSFIYDSVNDAWTHAVPGEEE